MMRRLIKSVAALVLALVASGSAAQSQTTGAPLLFVHGFASDSSTWFPLRSQLAAQGFQTFGMSTSYFSDINSQANAVLSYAQGRGLPSRAPVLVAHSMGGLVARTLAHSMNAGGIMTVGSPHSGVPLAANRGLFEADMRWLLDQLGYVSALGACSIEWGGPCYDYSLERDGVLTVNALVWAIEGAFMYGDISPTQMVPGSPFLASLNATTSGEHTLDRRYTTAQLFDFERSYLPYRLLQSSWDASQSAMNSWYVGSYIHASGDELYWEWTYDDPDDPFYYQWHDGAVAMMNIGDFIVNLPEWWVALTGGWPSDGLIPVASQVYPGGVPATLVGVSHLEETSNPFVRDRAAQMSRDADPQRNAGIFWHRPSDGFIVYWRMDGSAHYIDNVAIGTIPIGYSVVQTVDFNGDGKTDLIGRDLRTGAFQVKFMNGTGGMTGGVDASIADTSWRLAAVADLGGSATPDFVLQDTTGLIRIWPMNADGTHGAPIDLGSVGKDWKVRGAADYNGDTRPDLIFRNQATGVVIVWPMAGGFARAAGNPSPGIGSAPTSYEIAAYADMNHDGIPDVVWFGPSVNGNRTISWWRMNSNGTVASTQDSPGSVPAAFNFAGTFIPSRP